MSVSETQKEQLSVVYDKYSDMLFRLALSQLGNSDDAMDAVHDVFLKFFDVQPHFKDSEHERAWFIRSTVNRCHDIQRHKKIRSHPSLGEIGDIVAHGDDGESAQLYRALSFIPEKHSSVITLHYLEGFSGEETASILMITQSGVKMRLSRGRKALRRYIERREIMFSDKQKEANLAMKAPDELCERVLSSAEKSEKDNAALLKTPFARVAAAVACVALVAAAVFLAFNRSGIVISVNGAEIKENQTVALADAPSTSAVTGNFAEVTLSLGIRSDALITVDGGSFDVPDKEETDLTEYTAEENVEILWRSNGRQKSTMTVDCGRESCVLVLEFNGEWVVTRK